MSLTHLRGRHFIRTTCYYYFNGWGCNLTGNQHDQEYLPSGSLCFMLPGFHWMRNQHDPQLFLQQFDSVPSSGANVGGNQPDYWVFPQWTAAFSSQPTKFPCPWVNQGVILQLAVPVCRPSTHPRASRLFRHMAWTDCNISMHQTTTVACEQWFCKLCIASQ